MIKTKLRLIPAALAAIGAGGLIPAMPAAAQSSLLEEVVVTAQKREENLGDVPVAVSVLGSDQIEYSFANGIEELQAYVPSVSFRTGNTTRNSALTVRGIGTISFSIGAEPSVSTVVDNVVLGRSGQAFGDLGMAVVFSLLASYVVAVFFIPMLSSRGGMNLASFDPSSHKWLSFPSWGRFVTDMRSLKIWQYLLVIPPVYLILRFVLSFVFEIVITTKFALNVAIFLL